MARPPGLETRGCIIKTGEQNYVLIGEWPDMTTLADARGQMIATLNTFRHSLEDLGPGLAQRMQSRATWCSR